VNYSVILTSLHQQYPTVAHILTRSANLAFRPKSDFKNKCPSRARFGLQNEACLELCDITDGLAQSTNRVRSPHDAFSQCERKVYRLMLKLVVEVGNKV